MNIQDHTLNGFLQSYGDADFDIDFAPLERFPERRYVIRTDTDEAIGVEFVIMLETIQHWASSLLL